MKYKETKELDTKYDSSVIENRCLRFWEAQKTYRYDNKKSREETFIIDTPPPTVSGSLHIGHIFSYTQTDIVARFQRMSGKSVFYPIGWDDNGLPTERRVQNYYNISCNPNLPYDPTFVPQHNLDTKEPMKEVSRKNFTEACEELTKSDEKIFEEVFRRIGHSYDWDLKYSTIDHDAIRISQESFIKMFEDKQVEQVEAPTMWDVTFQSAIAQAEIEDREVEGYFYDIKFGLDGTDDNFTISTTRPELLPACIAIVAHPDDDRYKHLFGKTAIVPLFEAPVPIVASAHAEIDKGTGIMMVCTFGDAADVAWWKQSGLPLKQIIDRDGRLLKIHYGDYPFISKNPQKAQENYAALEGLTAKQARLKIISQLTKSGDLVNEPRLVKHPVKFYEKGNLPLEFVSSRQWFVKLLDEKQRIIAAGEKIKWKPSHMQHRFIEWAKGLNQDWCISRQRFFGVPFPLWYKLDTDGKPDYQHPIIADRKQLPVDPMSDVPFGFTEKDRNQKGGFIGAVDVMDTWATSALTPQIALAKAPKEAHISLPLDVRPQAHDIIRTWAFYTVAKSLLHENKLPWKQALISGFILDPDRKKMSKSKGNVVTPMHLIEQYSADAVRYWAAKARLGVDTAFDEQVMANGRKLTVKLFNAAKFVSAIVQNSSLSTESDYQKYITEPVDQSWMNKLATTTEYTTRALKANDYAAALDAVETRFWDFCDNYLEIVKKRAYSENNRSAVASLMQTTDTFAKMFAPFCPFISEEIYQSRSWGKDNRSLHLQKWPNYNDFDKIKTVDSLLYDNMVAITSEVRSVKTQANKSQKTPIKKMVIKAPAEIASVLHQAQSDLENVGNIAPGGIHYRKADNLEVDDIVLDLEYIAPKGQKQEQSDQAKTDNLAKISTTDIIRNKNAKLY
ncbi:MAG: valine--tRNA ligase [Alphaproteobacteria bacterium]